MTSLELDLRSRRVEKLPGQPVAVLERQLFLDLRLLLCLGRYRLPGRALCESRKGGEECERKGQSSSLPAAKERKAAFRKPRRDEHGKVLAEMRMRVRL